MKKFLCLAMAAMMLLMMAACGGSASSAPAAEGDVSAPAAGGDAAEAGGEGAGLPAEIFIGGLAPLTGDAALYGTMAKNGAELAVKEINEAGGINGSQISFKYEDEQGDATEAVNAYNKLVEEGMVALWGDVTTKPSIAVAQRAVEDNIPMITPTGTGAEITEGRGNVFRACFTDPYQGTLMAHYAVKELGAKTAAVLYDSTDDYSEGLYETFKATAEELGLELVAEESYENGASDFNAQLTKIKNLNPDVVMAPCYYPDASKIIPQARTLGLESKFLGPDGWASLREHMSDSGNLEQIDGVYYSNQYDMANPGEAMQKFMDDFSGEYGEKPDMFAALGYEAMHMLATAIGNADSVEADEIVEAFHRLQYEGLYGSISYENGNDPVRSACIMEFVKGEEVALGEFSAE